MQYVTFTLCDPLRCFCADFFALDMIWLGVIASSLYKSQLGNLLGPVNWPIAIVFYLLFLVGLTIFVTAPAVIARDIWYALFYGAMFGFFTYATYDLTSWATLRDWPWLISLADMAWGTILSASVATGTYWIFTTFFLK